MLRHRHDRPTARLIAGRTAVGFHPRDGRPVAVWVLHPTSQEPRAVAELSRAIADLGLDESGALPTLDPERADVTAADHWATLWTGEDALAVAPHDELWLDAVLDRGWLLVVAGWSLDLRAPGNDVLHRYLSGDAPAGLGIVRLP
ncbi:hypothetical protein [Cellulomonas taurus]|uniref:hypothetical protein n=1 Tax=Cellulomonas taurus TaxID=2729175 RepID=UPI00145D5E5F|nr:hypothetical protein [Cellulomonas taurus]